MDQRIAAKNEAKIFAGIRSLGNAEIARLLECAESTVTELGTQKYKLNFKSVSSLLARMGLKIVPAENKCYHPDDIENIISMAKKYMQSLDAKSLEFDD